RNQTRFSSEIHCAAAITRSDVRASDRAHRAYLEKLWCQCRPSRGGVIRDDVSSYFQVSLVVFVIVASPSMSFADDRRMFIAPLSAGSYLMPARSIAGPPMKYFDASGPSCRCCPDHVGIRSESMKKSAAHALRSSTVLPLPMHPHCGNAPTVWM